MKLESLLKKLPEELDGAMITSEENRRYFTEFPSTAGVLIVSRGGSVFLTDSRYVEAASKKIKCCPVRETKNLKAELPALMREFNIRRIGIEAQRVTVSDYAKYKDMLGEVEVSADGAVDRAITSLRMIKSADEIALMKSAQEIAERAFTHILDFIKPGVTEREVSLELDYFMLRSGAEALSFETIAVSGVNSSMPHGVPSDKKIENGDFVTMDYGAVCGGYHSDMTRTVAVGNVSAEQKKVYDTVLKAQLAALEAMRPGVRCADADRAARDVIAAAGYGEFFGHGTGHGVGIEIHEEPRVSPTAADILEAGNVVTDEPGIYIPSRFGVRIEDMVLITENGFENLTKAPKELIVL